MQAIDCRPMVWGKFLLTVLISLLMLSGGTNPAKAEVESGTYLWFDLGNVLVETRDGFNKLRWMPGAHKMIQQLRRRGYSIGLISNVPENWGTPGQPDSKIPVLQRELNRGWIGENPILLSQFDKIFVPDNKSQAKPAEYLFRKAMAWAKASGKESFFQGESPREVYTAESIGMHSFLVEFDSSGRNPKYYPIDKIDQLFHGDHQ